MLSTQKSLRSDSAVVELVERWLADVVIAQQFCPFAAKPFAEDDVLVEVVRQEPPQQLEALARRLLQMSVHELPETSLLVFPADYDTFAAFQDLVEQAEHLAEELAPGQFQIAAFHPAYQFAHLPAGDAAHYIHRAPFAIVQLLRCKSLAFAKTLHDREALLVRNAEHARNLGAGFFRSFQVGGE